MFEELVKLIIDVLKSITNKIEQTYYETFGDKELSREFMQEVMLRRDMNKQIFVRKAAGFVGRKVLEEEGYLITPNQALQIGEVIFDSANNAGMIDILNNVIER